MAPVTVTPLYTATATAQGGRNGRIRSSDGVLDMPLAMPKELGGAGGAVTNPEQLFAAGYAACFESALGVVARRMKVEHPGFHLHALENVGHNPLIETPDRASTLLHQCLQVSAPSSP